MRIGRNIVIGIDSSTTATKAIAWRQDGPIAGRGRSPIPLLSPADNWYEQDAKDWCRSAYLALRELFQQVTPADVAAISIATREVRAS